MSEIPANKESKLTEIHDEVRVYLPDLMIRLAVGYGLPFLGVVVISVLLQLFLPQSIPGSTQTILAFAAYLIFLYVAWKALERRTHATALFVQYSAYSSQRRQYKKSLENGSTEALSLSDVRTAAEDFLRSAREHGLQPRGNQ